MEPICNWFKGCLLATTKMLIYSVLLGWHIFLHGNILINITASNDRQTKIVYCIYTFLDYNIQYRQFFVKWKNNVFTNLLSSQTSWVACPGGIFSPIYICTFYILYISMFQTIVVILYIIKHYHTQHGRMLSVVILIVFLFCFV